MYFWLPVPQPGGGPRQPLSHFLLTLSPCVSQQYPPPRPAAKPAGQATGRPLQRLTAPLRINRNTAERGNLDAGPSREGEGKRIRHWREPAHPTRPRRSRGCRVVGKSPTEIHARTSSPPRPAGWPPRKPTPFHFPVLGVTVWADPASHLGDEKRLSKIHRLFARYRAIASAPSA